MMLRRSARALARQGGAQMTALPYPRACRPSGAFVLPYRKWSLDVKDGHFIRAAGGRGDIIPSIPAACSARTASSLSAASDLTLLSTRGLSVGGPSNSRLGGVQMFSAVAVSVHNASVTPASSYAHPTSTLIGDVVVGENCSIWPYCVIRGDVNRIVIGDGTNVQDGTVIHASGDWHGPGTGFATQVGANVSIGHKALLHGCTIEDSVLVGMGCTVMDGAVVKSGVLLGAGSLVPPGKILHAGLWVGSPAKRVRDLTDKERQYIKSNAEHYHWLKNEYIAKKSVSS